MERVLVSRQPIYSAEMAVLGYELLFRDSDVNRASFSDGDQATAEVILNTFMDIGLQEVVGQQLAFINFGRNLIMGNYCESLPSERVVLELLESVEADDGPVLPVKVGGAGEVLPVGRPEELLIDTFAIERTHDLLFCDVPDFYTSLGQCRHLLPVGTPHGPRELSVAAILGGG